MSSELNISKEKLIVKSKIDDFFNKMKNDPIFIGLDTNFKSNNSEFNFNALIIYLHSKSNKFVKKIHKKFNYKIILFYSDDNLNPIYNGYTNNYKDYISGKITLPSKKSYESLNIANTTGYFSDLTKRKFYVAQKLGVPGGTICYSDQQQQQG